MDAPVIDARVLADSLDDLAAVNRWLGGRRAVLRALAPLLPPGGAVLDVGTGSGDVPRAIARRARTRREPVRIVGCDLHRQTVAIASDRCRAEPAIEIVRGNALALPFADRSFDIALLSLTLHHFDDGAQITALRELARVARQAVLVNELERTWTNYLGARILAATLWRDNPLTRHDGPLSVLRAFTADELLARARSAGLRDARVDRRFFNRLVLTAGTSADWTRTRSRVYFSGGTP
jgi:ubiquinone/menaquinone biosynthesis C-methylase UbiE